MPQAHLKQVSQPQQERLAYIEYRLLFLGCINRSDLVNRFGLKESAASRDLAQYRELASGNIDYNTVDRTYRLGSAFRPLFNYSPEQVLTVLADGFGDDFVTTATSPLPTERPSRLNTPSIEILAPVSRALFNTQSLRIAYRSLTSGFTERIVVPLTLVDNGLRWHLRAFDTEHQRYADFVLNRIVCAEVEPHDASDLTALRDADEQWQQQLSLELVPHPALEHPETIAFEYGMSDGVLKVEVRLALAGYLLRRWNVDCTPDHRMQGYEYHLWLRNSDTLRRTARGNESNLAIAPGFTERSADRLQQQYQ